MATRAPMPKARKAEIFARATFDRLTGRWTAWVSFGLDTGTLNFVMFDLAVMPGFKTQHQAIEHANGMLETVLGLHKLPTGPRPVIT